MAVHLEIGVTLVPPIVELALVWWLCLWAVFDTYFGYLGGGASCAPLRMQDLD
jgi:hypothetical protein